MEKRYYVDTDTWERKYYEVFAPGDVVELVDTKNLINRNNKEIFVVEKYCPQIGVGDKIKTTCGCFIYTYRFKLRRGYRFKLKELM